MNIDRRKRMEEELRSRSLELESFAQTMSHDLRSPISLIGGYAEAEIDALDSIMRAAHHMDDSVTSLLEYAGAESPAGQAERVEPAGIVGEILEGLGVELERRGLEIDVQGDMPAVPLDPLRLEQALANLVGNAVKHMTANPQPRIEIGASSESETVTFFVGDNGPGLPPNKLDQIFRPFKSFSITGTQGLGIGLSTVKRAVEGWGGRAWVESAPGEGATFFFTAPSA
ncbi:MAG: HAMP domain-containing sensor histidine kinase [Actinomycetota bacterium]|nr:HAMP domain-containing sensor histidine kinase [Actinomycetota bacterium]